MRFDTPRLDELAFTKIFPNGKFGMKWPDRKVDVSDTKYLRRYLRAKDRSRIHAQYIFAMVDYRVSTMNLPILDF